MRPETDNTPSVFCFSTSGAAMSGSCVSQTPPVSRDREVMRDFISAYRNLPELWDVRNKFYTKKNKRYEAYQKLVTILSRLKSEANVGDVKKKINSLRSNYRKEVKKVEEAARLRKDPRDDVYQPTSWFEELSFLKDLDIVVQGGCSGDNSEVSLTGDTEEDLELQECQANLNFDYIEVLIPPRKPGKRKHNELPDPLPLQYDYTSNQDDSNIAKVWEAKFKTLPPDQKFYAEKAINDILFEAQMGTLYRDSVKIN